MDRILHPILVHFHGAAVDPEKWLNDSSTFVVNFTKFLNIIIDIRLKKLEEIQSRVFSYVTIYLGLLSLLVYFFMIDRSINISEKIY